MTRRDNVSKNIINNEVLVVAAAESSVTSSAIDTKDIDSICLAITPIDASSTYAEHTITADDDIRFTIQESDDDDTYTAIDADQYLPTSGDYSEAADRAVENGSEGAMKIGVLSTKRYLKIKFDTVALDSIANPNLLLSVAAVKRDRQIPA